MSDVTRTVAEPVQTWLGQFLSNMMLINPELTQVIALLFYAFFLLIVLDVITGWMKGFYLGDLDSARNHQGYIKKVALLVIGISAIGVDFVISSGLFYAGFKNLIFLGINIVEVPLVSGVMISWLGIGEILSIIENLEGMGVPLPSFIRKGLNRVKTNIDKGNIDMTSTIERSKDGKVVVENTIEVPPAPRDGNTKKDDD